MLTIPEEFKKVVRRYRRSLFEIFGNDYYSRPAIELEKKIEKYLPERGFFIEVGANDGFSQSNTYYLEVFKGWRGVLIEPIPKLYKQCARIRRKSKVFNCALVSFDYSEPTVRMNFGHLMSHISGAFGNKEAEVKHLERARSYYHIDSYELDVPARTLTSILDELNVKKIDFFSLDVEGYELNVLKGLDFSKYKPNYLLIECLNAEAKEIIESHILDIYTFVEKISIRDYLYRRCDLE